MMEPEMEPPRASRASRGTSLAEEEEGVVEVAAAEEEEQAVPLPVRQEGM